MKNTVVIQNKMLGVSADYSEVKNEIMFLEMVLNNKFNRLILDKMENIGCEDCWLTAGCLAQTVWNINHHYNPENSISDYDLFYFDKDTSYEAEDYYIQKTKKVFEYVDVNIEIRNQARIHLWYENKFGIPYEQNKCSFDGIKNFLSETNALGVRKKGDDFEIYAPFGVDLCLDGIVKPNKNLKAFDNYKLKTERWKKEWPNLKILNP